MAENTMKSRLRDALAVALFFPALPFLRFAGPRRTYLHAVRGLLDRAGVTVMANYSLRAVLHRGRYLSRPGRAAHARRYRLRT